MAIIGETEQATKSAAVQQTGPAAAPITGHHHCDHSPPPATSKGDTDPTSSTQQHESSLLVGGIFAKTMADLRHQRNDPTTATTTKCNKDAAHHHTTVDSKSDQASKCNLNFSISNILSKDNSLMHNLRDNLLTGNRRFFGLFADVTDSVRPLETAAANPLYQRPTTFQFDPIALQSSLLSAHLLGAQPVVSSAPALSEHQKTHLLPSMLFASSLHRKQTAWYPWSLTTSTGLFSGSNFETPFGSGNFNIFATKEAKDGKSSSLKQPQIRVPKAMA